MDGMAPASIISPLLFSYMERLRIEVTALSCVNTSSDVRRLTRTGIAPASAISILLSVLRLDSDRSSVTAALRSSTDRQESFRTRASIAAMSPVTSLNDPSLFFNFPLVSPVGCSMLCSIHH